MPSCQELKHGIVVTLEEEASDINVSEAIAPVSVRCPGKKLAFFGDIDFVETEIEWQLQNTMSVNTLLLVMYFLEKGAMALDTVLFLRIRPLLFFGIPFPNLKGGFSGKNHFLFS